MKHRVTIVLAILGSALTPTRAETPLYVTPDVPTLTQGGTRLFPWQVFRYDAAGPTYTLELTLPGEPRISAIHKLDQPGGWLFSFEAATDLGGALLTPSEPRDIIRYDGDANDYQPLLCGVPVGIPPGVNIDAIFVEGGDAGDLIVSFEVPVELPAGSGVFYEPSDLVRFERAGAGCGAWTLADANPAFDASSAGSGVSLAVNIVGAGNPVAGKPIFSINVPSELLPSTGAPTYVRSQIASWDGDTFDLFEELDGWPQGSMIAALSCQANPGRIGQLRLAKAPLGQLLLSWSPSCASGADDYGIYEGTMAAIDAGSYDHAAIDCNDAAPSMAETITPGDGSHYYLVVPFNNKSEGSYGTATAGAERPQTSGEGCAAAQTVTQCP